MRQIAFFILFILSANCISQVISEFNWNNGSVTTADVGPNAISVSSSAIVDVNGSNGTTGLNAGTPKLDIDLTLPGSYFEGMSGIDFQIDFQRDETRGDFITCGTTFAFGIDGGDLYVTFEIDDTNGGSTVINETNIYTIPDDDKFRNYRFYYLPSNGTARVIVDNTVVWSNTYSASSPLIWPNQDVIIGKLMDGNGFDKTIIDNLVIAEVYDSALPIELNDFSAHSTNSNVLLKWATASELNNDYFTLERSRDGIHFEQIATREGAGTSNTTNEYRYIDNEVNSGTYYYRLRQSDFNGQSSLSNIISVFHCSSDEFKIYPNVVQRGAAFNTKTPKGLDVKRIEIHSTDGRRRHAVKNIGNHHISIKSPASAGIFTVCFITNDGVVSRKLVVR